MSLPSFRTTCIAIAVLAATNANAASKTGANGLFELSLEDLLQVEVTSVAKKPQRLADAAAAVFVITDEDIRRSGARSIPEALRMAPGVDVARISGNRWAVSMRGFTDRLSNKLLILVDGRNAYSPSFSGAFWETFQFPLEDIERIEVVRGPGASIWGTNAVNGVINIITKSATATLGGLVKAGVGSREGQFGSIRYGDALPDSSMFYRVYTKGTNSESFERADGSDAHDRHDDTSAGFRLDAYTAAGNPWSLSADFYRSRVEGESFMPVLPIPYTAQLRDAFSGANLRASYDHRLTSGSELKFQAALSRSDIDWGPIVTEQRTTLDLDFQHRLGLGQTHDVTWGLGYRRSEDEILSGPLATVNDPKETLQIFSAFVQDEIALRKDLHLTLGLRLDHQEYTDLEAQPTARLLWNISPSESAWLSVSRAVRPPSRGERDFTYNLGLAMGGIPVLAKGTPGYDAEYLNAYELGYRAQWTPRLYFDANVFLHDYDKLRNNSAPLLVPGPALEISLENKGRMRLYGTEVSADWRVSDQWRLQAAYTYQEATDITNVEFTAGLIPKHIVSLRAGYTPRQDLNFDLWLRHVAERPSATETYYRVAAYTTLDLRLAWQARRGLEFSIVGQDLLDNRHNEFVAQVPQLTPTALPRGIYGQVRWDF